MRRLGKLAWAMGLMVTAPVILAVSGGQVDTFSGGTTAGWQHGSGGSRCRVS